MTKEYLAKQIIETVKNCLETNDEQTANEFVINWLDTLEPKDRFTFARWGTEHERSTEKECWI